MCSHHDRGWDEVYHNRNQKSLPWELGKPRDGLINIVEKGLVPPDNALDLCCGTGTNPIYLAKKGFEVTALDISDKAVEIAKKKSNNEGVEILFLVADFLHLPLLKEQFNFIFDFGCFHHVKINDRTNFIEGIYRVLKYDGILLLTCFSDKNGEAWNHFTRNQLKRIFQDFFKIKWIKHFSSIEGDNVKRFFYEVLMIK
jgi:ubiquinone/menaquinone biosynthesis C-methylase UbiE